MSRLFKFSLAVVIAGFLSFGAWAENPEHVQQARETGSCSGCDLSNAYLKNLQASEGDLSYASLQSANLTFAILTASSLDGADLSGADLSGADLSLASISGANLAGVITDANTTCLGGEAGPCSF